MNNVEVIKLASREMERRMKAGEVKCNCGGPSLGTDHAPDCQVNLAWDDVVADVKQDIYERDNP